MYMKTGREQPHLTLVEVVTSPSLSQTQALILGQSHHSIVFRDAMISIGYLKHLAMMIMHQNTGERDPYEIIYLNQQNTTE